MIRKLVNSFIQCAEIRRKPMGRTRRKHTKIPSFNNNLRSIYRKTIRKCDFRAISKSQTIIKHFTHQTLRFSLSVHFLNLPVQRTITNNLIDRYSSFIHNTANSSFILVSVSIKRNISNIIREYLFNILYKIKIFFCHPVT